MNKELLDQKYIKLLLERCLNFEKSSILFINYNKEIKPFIDKIVTYAKKLGLEEIYLDEDDPELIKETLLNITEEELDKCPLFNKSIWDEYAKKNASFLMLETENPGLMDEVAPSKLAKASYLKRATRPIFREKEGTNQIPWCIAAYPGQSWANSIFKNDPNAYNKLYQVILKMCMVDENDPITNWNNYINTSKILINKLNNLKIKTLHYTNSRGTDLLIKLPETHIWVGAGTENNLLVNMPSYEIFTSPDYRYTNGIVYSAKPLIYNGALIEDFYIIFKDGKAISSGAKKGSEVLTGIINSDQNSCYLGEVSLINHDSPISNTGLVFGTTLFDENASCHLALGDSFPECLEKGLSKTKEELLQEGLNNSKNHVDFMIGTSDLNITAETINGTIPIFQNGNFVI